MPCLMLNSRNYTGGGGGGNANERELTWAEYCALTDEEKNDGTTYYIKDINGDFQNFQPVIYSFDEREIGVWTDGKPLYQKTVKLAQTTTTEDPLVADISDLSIDAIVMCDGICKNQYNYIIPLPYAHYDDRYCMTLLINDTKTRLELRLGTGNRPAYDVNVTLRYTKNTDTPGSGTWTPQGVPTVHYSTDEQVVGTWIDGSTMYERTIIVPEFNANTSDSRIGSYYGMVDISSYVQNPTHVFVDLAHTYITLQDTTTRTPLYADWQGGDSFIIFFPFAARTGELSVTIRYIKTTS